MNQDEERIVAMLAEEGYPGRMVAIEHLEELRQEIAARRAAGLLDETLIQRYLSDWQFDYTKQLPEARSILVVAAAQPLMQLEFEWRGSFHPVLVPPTYIAEDDGRVAATVAHALQSKGYHGVQARLPQKLLAVRSGLSRYGRNNISYIEGMGSFYTIMAFFTDLPLSEDSWQEASKMPECEACRVCLRNCPTGCIDPERFLIHAERCLTYLNENSGEFPDWVNAHDHHALVGCMKCQTVCPQNRERLRTVVMKETFHEAETAAILSGVALEQLPGVTQQTLKRLGMTDYCQDRILARNLGVLLAS
ncbi:epoxyqueuosine reductase [Hydrogenispora ethanolica]|jgi:epoxyqueuosine reductase|uniref:Epoxyqueuosine reductase n=1 Tax=Hydrogenispora ethanolica TaxID=1082276 RepID=A0A4R1RX19_HYDET|nr:4Fe-4S double cluster binding domain-containing protein [Hydrogenispora ethanolica]TCL70720.1 epoxyqueuosine reductase [Hydrogenispora ethanolica]